MFDRPKPTIRDSARLAGVSRSTVSLVINEDRRISVSTKARVLEVIAARRLLSVRPRPTALMAANDMMAIGALRVARDERGLRIPEDLTVVGADDVRLTTYVRPPLTTLSPPMFEIGKMATRLVVRESSAPPSPPGR